MDYETADKIIERFQTHPTNRIEQERLINLVGYTRLKTKKGLQPLKSCEDRMIHSVSRDYYSRAIRTITEFWNNIDDQIRQGNEQEFTNIDYPQFLCEIFNIPEEERQRTNQNELEQMINN